MSHAWHKWPPFTSVVISIICLMQLRHECDQKTRGQLWSIANVHTTGQAFCLLSKATRVKESRSVAFVKDTISVFFSQIAFQGRCFSSPLDDERIARQPAVAAQANLRRQENKRVSLILPISSSDL